MYCLAYGFQFQEDMDFLTDICAALNTCREVEFIRNIFLNKKPEEWDISMGILMICLQGVNGTVPSVRLQSLGKVGK